jgi:hypothetical protein
VSSLPDGAYIFLFVLIATVIVLALGFKRGERSPALLATTTGYRQRLTTPTNEDGQPEETPGGSTIADPVVFNNFADNDGDDLDAPDPS